MTADGSLKQGLAPVIDSESRFLILGTLPGDDSLAAGQYYTNKSNHFWTILAAVYDEPIDADYERRLTFLRSKRLALWDMLCSACRHGSLDHGIKNEQPNNFTWLFTAYPALRAIGFNGGTAQQMFGRYVQRELDPKLLKGRQLFPLPSTSGTPGKNILPLQEKVERWKIIASV